MKVIKVPGSTSNIGPGFDCLGMALSVYNTFSVSLSDKDELENILEPYNNRNNLFLKAYRKGLEYLGEEDNVHVYFDCDVPISRGLGSSATFIVGGLCAASALHGDKIPKDVIYQLASHMEGHPDNVAPCLFGGFTAATLLEDGTYIYENLPIHDSWRITIFTPDTEVSTSEAREVLPEIYTKDIAVSNGCKAILAVKALNDGDQELFNKVANDAIHEPYRKDLIPNFDEMKALLEEDTNGKFLISGSGSTCILFHHEDITSDALNKIQQFDSNWEIKEVTVSNTGVEIEDAS